MHDSCEHVYITVLCPPIHIILNSGNMDQTDTLPMAPAEADEVLQKAKVEVGSFEKRMQQLAPEEPPQVPFFQARTLAMQGCEEEATDDIPVPLPQPPTAEIERRSPRPRM